MREDQETLLREIDSAYSISRYTCASTHPVSLAVTTAVTMKEDALSRGQWVA